MVDQEGLLYFWSGLGALLFRELPFAIAKVSEGLPQHAHACRLPAVKEYRWYGM